MCLAVTCLAVDSVDGHVAPLGLLTSVHVPFLRVGTFSSPDIWMLEYPRAQFSALFSVFIDSTRNLTGLMKEISEHFKRNVVLGLVKVERSMFLVGTSA